MAMMLELLLMVTFCISTFQLSPNIVTEEVKTRVVKTKYGKVQGFVSKVNNHPLKTSRSLSLQLHYIAFLPNIFPWNCRFVRMNEYNTNAGSNDCDVA